MRQRQNLIDNIKAICIIFVIITHFSWAGSERIKYFFCFWINQAVPIFMIISGYLYSLSYQKNAVKTFEDAYRHDIIINRVIRYSLPFLLIFMFEMMVNNIPVLKFLPRFFSGGMGPGSYYYPILIQLIFIFPIIYFIIKKYDFKGLLSLLLFNILYEVLKGTLFIGPELYRICIFRYLVIIAFGCYIAIGVSELKKWVLVTVFIIGTTWLYGVYCLGWKPIINNLWITTGFMAAFYICPIMWTVLRLKLFNFHSYILGLIGESSYNIYLVQMVFFVFYAKNIYRLVPERFYAYLCCAFICVFVGLIFHFFEKKITNCVLRWVKNRDYLSKHFNSLLCGIQTVCCKKK